MVKKVWDMLSLNLENIVKILKFSKTVLKIGMVVHVTVGCVRVDLN